MVYLTEAEEEAGGGGSGGPRGGRSRVVVDAWVDAFNARSVGGRDKRGGEDILFDGISGRAL